MTVKTIVVCMLEHRSFDHLLGWMSLPPYGSRTDIEGLGGDVDHASRELVRLQYENPSKGHLYRPIMLDADLALSTDLPHGRTSVAAQMHLDPHGGGYLM